MPKRKSIDKRKPTKTAEEEGDDGWGTGYLYKAPDYKPGEHPMERDEVTWHHIWAPPAKKSKD